MTRMTYRRIFNAMDELYSDPVLGEHQTYYVILSPAKGVGIIVPDHGKAVLIEDKSLLRLKLKVKKELKKLGVVFYDEVRKK